MSISLKVSEKTAKFITKSHQVGQIRFALGKSVLTVHSHFLLPHVPRNVSREDMVRDFPEAEVGLSGTRLLVRLLFTAEEHLFLVCPLVSPVQGHRSALWELLCTDGRRGLVSDTRGSVA